MTAFRMGPHITCAYYCHIGLGPIATSLTVTNGARSDLTGAAARGSALGTAQPALRENNDTG